MRVDTPSLCRALNWHWDSIASATRALRGTDHTTGFNTDYSSALGGRSFGSIHFFLESGLGTSVQTSSSTDLKRGKQCFKKFMESKCSRVAACSSVGPLFGAEDCISALGGASTQFVLIECL